MHFVIYHKDEINTLKVEISELNYISFYNLSYDKSSKTVEE